MISLKVTFSILDQNLDHGDFVYILYVIKRMDGFKWSCSHVWHLHNVFNLILFGFWVTNAFDTWLSIYKACSRRRNVYLLSRVINYFSLLFFLCFCHYSLYKCGMKGKLGIFLHNTIWRGWKLSFVSEIWKYTINSFTIYIDNSIFLFQ